MDFMVSPERESSIGGLLAQVCKSTKIISSSGLLKTYRILGIVRGRKLSRITFIDVVCEKTFTGSPVLRSPNN